MRKPILDPPVRTPLDLLRHRLYLIAVLLNAIIPSLLASAFLLGPLGIHRFLAVPLGILVGFVFSWLTVYLEALGMIEGDATD